jgi:hypothetical protein
VRQNASGWQVLEANTRSAHAARRRFFATEVRQEWFDLANRFDKWDEKIDSFVAPNIDISLNRGQPSLPASAQLARGGDLRRCTKWEEPESPAHPAERRELSPLFGTTARSQTWSYASPPSTT